MQDAKTLTAIVLCKDSAPTLSRTLASLSFCDRLVVCDDGSSDDSIKIARNSGAQILVLSKTNSFSQKRNEAMQKVSSDWYLFIDSDEVLETTLATQIKIAISREGFTGFFIKRRDIFLGKLLRFGETGNTKLLRLVKAGSGKWERMVHEVFIPSGKAATIHMGKIIHHPHPSLSDFFESLNHYTDLEVEERIKFLSKSSWMTPLVYIQLATYPVLKFLRNYVMLGGFADGYIGFIHAYFMSLHSLFTRIKVIEYIRSRN